MEHSSSVFDSEFTLSELETVVSSTTGKTVDVCTVRSPDVATSSLGNLFWMLVAKRFSNQGCHVNVFDFPNDTPEPAELPVEELADCLGIEDITISRAEHQDQTQARAKLHEFAKQYRQSPDQFLGIHPRVAKGLLRSTDEKLDPSLNRMVEELAVFLQGAQDDQRIQVMGHEQETVQLIRYMTATDKRYFRAHLGGIVSEFRAIKIPTIAEFPDRLLMGRSQGDMYNHFFTYVLTELADALARNAQKGMPWIEMGRFDESSHWAYARGKHAVDAAGKLSSRLRPFVAAELFDRQRLDEGEVHITNPDEQWLYFEIGNQRRSPGESKDDVSKYLLFSDADILNEVQVFSEKLSTTEKPDYNPVLRILSQAHHLGNPTLRSAASAIIQSALPTLTEDELVEHGERFYRKIGNTGQAVAFFEEYANRGCYERVEDIVAYTKGSASGSVIESRILSAVWRIEDNKRNASSGKRS